jgi:predicted transcriptional regulator
LCGLSPKSVINSQEGEAEMTRHYDPGMKLRLLRIVEKHGPLTFTEWWEKSPTTRQTLNQYRKHLLEEGLIERDSIERTYSLTAKGAVEIMEAEEGGEKRE